jgi:sugar-specific transcriptional regulator TrmB
MSFEKSNVMREFGRIMAEQGLVKTANEMNDALKAVEPNPYAENIKDIVEKRLKQEKDMIEEAHPEPVYVAEALGDGGLVENQNEQHQKLIEMINKMPTGIIVHRYAAAIDSLIKMAAECDEVDEGGVSDILTEAATKLVGMLDQLPLT